MSKYETPQLPKGYFFRVSLSHVLHYTLRVEVRRRRWFGSSYVDCDVSIPDKDNVYSAMLSLQRHLGYQTRQNELIGDYPPKKL